MRLVRIYHDGTLAENDIIELSHSAHAHISKVLRFNIEDTFQIFDGCGNEFSAKIVESSKKFTRAQILTPIENNNESPLALHLLQGISRPERMDFAIQKAVELGVTEITPLLTEYCQIKLPKDRQEKRMQHWKNIMISACEQSGRSVLPKLNTITPLNHYLAKPVDDLSFILSPHHESTSLDNIQAEKINVIIGPEGGFSEQEITLTMNANCKPLRLGPRILRTETAALAALSVLQATLGDFFASN